MHETVKLLGSTKSKITKDENSKYFPNWEINEVALLHCNIVSSIDQTILGHFFQINPIKNVLPQKAIKKINFIK